MGKKEKKYLRRITILFIPAIIFINTDLSYLRVLESIVLCGFICFAMLKWNEKITPIVFEGITLILTNFTLGIFPQYEHEIITLLIMLLGISYVINSSYMNKEIMYLRKKVNKIIIINLVIWTSLIWSDLNSNLLICLFLIVLLQFTLVLGCSINNLIYIVWNFKRYDWNASINVQKSPNVIVIGAGIAGLTVAALLAKKGVDVLVLEKQSHVGGFCSTFSRKGYKFNTGVEDVSGIWKNGAITRLLEKLEISDINMFKKNTTHYFYKKKRYAIPSELSQIIDLFAHEFKEERENIKRFFSEALLAYEECYADTKKFGTPLPPELIYKTGGIKAILEYPSKYPHFYSWMNKSYKSKLDEFFVNEDLKKILCALLVYIGTRPEETPARNGLAACVSYYLKNGYSIIGGAQKFAELLERYIINHGGKVKVNTKIQEILVKDGKAVGAKTNNNEVYYAPIVISNVNAKTTYVDLINNKHISNSFKNKIMNKKMSKSYFMLFLGIDLDLSKYPILLKNLDENWEIVINSNVSRQMAPNNCSSITVLVSEGISYNLFPERNTKEYNVMKEKIEKDIINKISSYIPELEKHIIVKESATPKTFERYNDMPEGAVYSIDQSINTERPFFKSPIEGLYLVGASVFPGAGVEAAVISGTICANDIYNWRY